jgi:hypothetical protein
MRHNNGWLCGRMPTVVQFAFQADTTGMNFARQKIAMIVMGIPTSLKDLCMAALKKPRLVCTYVLTKVRPGCKCLI